MRTLIRRFMRDPDEARSNQDNTCVYAIGDIHGRADLLDEICRRIDADIQAERPQRPVQIFLGDYIDRGPDSSLVISTLEARRKSQELVCLLGNHEACLLDFLVDPDMLSKWRQFGALQTLISYGLSPSSNPDARERKKLSEQLSQAMPENHQAFLQSLPTSYSLGRYFFAHAGIRPGVRLDQQRDQDLLWIRDEFLLCEDDFGKIVVHGHTPVHEPELLANRINIDTGAYATGRLTCIKLQGLQRTLL